MHTAGATMTKNYSLTVNAAIAVTPATLPNGTVFAPYNQTVSSTGGTGPKSVGGRCVSGGHGSDSVDASDRGGQVARLKPGGQCDAGWNEIRPS